VPWEKRDIMEKRANLKKVLKRKSPLPATTEKQERLKHAKEHLQTANDSKQAE